MALLAYNKTTSPLALVAGNPAPTLPASPTGGVPGVPFNVTAELRPDTTVDLVNGVAGGLVGADYIALEVQVTATDVVYEWTSDPEYLTPGLTVSGPAPAAHATNHENGGADEISVAGLSGALADAQTPTAHATSHENGGADEISVAGLSGALADAQTPTAHATSHENGGADEISVAGLSGALADAQTPTAHATSHENGGADEISVAGLSGALADAQTPTAHATSHESGGADVLSLTPDMDAVADADGLSSLLTIHKVFAAVGGSVADDVVVYTANSPFKFRVVDVTMRVTTLKAGGTLQLRDATGGGGNVLSQSFPTDAQALLREDGSGTTYASSVLVAGSSLVVRRSDNDAAGEVTILLRKET